MDSSSNRWFHQPILRVDAGGRQHEPNQVCDFGYLKAVSREQHGDYEAVFIFQPDFSA